MVQANWTSLGSPPSVNLIVSPHVVQTIDGRLEVFALDSQQALWNTGQSAPNGTWNPWASVAGPPNMKVGEGPVVGTNADGRLEVFTLDAQGGLWHIWQTSPGGGWSQWVSLGDPFAKAPLDLPTFTLARNGDGRLEVFTADQDGFDHSWQTTPNGGTWSPWALLCSPTQ